MTPRVEMIGRRFGRLTVVALSKKRGNRGQLKFDCVCDCGGFDNSYKIIYNF